MVYKVDFENVATTGLEDSPVAKELAELRASEARYFWNKYQSEFVTMSADENPEIINRIEAILKKHDLELPYTALAVSDFAVNNVRCSYIFYDNGLEVNLQASLDKHGKRSIGFKLVDGIDVPKELENRFRFVHQRSQNKSNVRGAYFIVQNNH
ncbi:phage tail protein [Companilactobacillus musae]|uniref:phage tail protein n=1 Tax=Companilactobacillus musae TaxID=1903258 RepID=UPI000E65911E|nr:phage tail protein [Companilactobacillus musae]